MLARKLANLGAVAMIAVGIGGALYPKEFSRGYGLDADSENAATYVQAAGARDIALGIILLRASLHGKNKALRTALLCGALVAGSDLLLVGTRTRDPGKVAIHATGVTGILFVWLLAKFRES